MKTNKHTIAIEAESIAGNHSITGIGRVVINYVTRFLAFGDCQFSYDIISVNPNAAVPDGLPYCRKFEILRDDNSGFFRRRFIKNYWRITHFKTLTFLLNGLIVWYRLQLKKPDLFIQTSPSIIPLFVPRKVRVMAFVYDYVWMHHRSIMDGDSFLFRWAMKKFIRNADVVITISDYIKSETKKYFNRENVFSIKLAADPETFSVAGEEEIGAVRKKYSIRKPYILSVCTLEPRKNLPALIRAFAGLADRDSYDLVLTGKPGWKNREIIKSMKLFGISGRVILTGYVTDDDLRGLYSGALMFVYPSMYEGFGLPVLEAMQCGCPVVTSNCSSLPEVVGDAGIKVDPDDIAGFREAMERLAGSAALRATLRKRGISRAATFSWEKSFQLLMERIRTLLF